MFGFPTIESEWNLLVDSFAKSNVPIEQIFLEPWVPKKMASWLNLLSKLLWFERKRYSQIFKENLKYYEFFSLKKWKMAMKKSKFWKKRLVIEPLDHEKWIPHSNSHQNNSVSAKNIFLKNFKTTIFLRNVFFWHLYEKSKFWKNCFL